MVLFAGRRLESPALPLPFRDAGDCLGDEPDIVAQALGNHVEVRSLLRCGDGAGDVRAPRQPRFRFYWPPTAAAAIALAARASSSCASVRNWMRAARLASR